MFHRTSHRVQEIRAVEGADRVIADTQRTLVGLFDFILRVSAANLWW